MTGMKAGWVGKLERDILCINTRIWGSASPTAYNKEAVWGNSGLKWFCGESEEQDGSKGHCGKRCLS